MRTIARTPDSTRIIKVIEVKCLRGEGTEEDIARTVIQYWSLDGELLAEDDPELQRLLNENCGKRIGRI